MTPLWPPSRRDLWLFGGLVVALFIAWLPRLLPGTWSPDDYALVHEGAGLAGTLRLEVSQGRFGQALLHTLLSRLGADPSHSSTLLSFLALLLLAAAAVVTVRIWDLQGSPGTALMAGAIALVHPFAADSWSFRLAPIFFALALLPALVAVLLLRRTSSGFLLPIALIASSLAIYQVNLNPLLVVILLGAALDLARVPAGSGEVRTVLKVWLVLLACVAVSTALYLAFNKLVLLATGIPPEARAGLVSLADLPGRLREIAALLPKLLFKERQLGTGLLGALQISLLALTLSVAILRGLAERSARKLAWIVALLGLAFLCIVGIVGLLRVFWPTPRVLTAAGFFWAGVLALTSVCAEPRARAAALGLGGLLLLGYAGIDHRASADQQRVNLRDQLTMSRVIARLERLPGAAGVRRAYLVGGPKAYGDTTVAGDLNNSALGVTWGFAGLVAEAGGPWLEHPRFEDGPKAAAHCAHAGRWPAEDSLAIEGDLAIVCF